MWLGVGPGNFGQAAYLEDPHNFPNAMAIVNNEPIELLTETGVLGLAAFGLFVVSLGRLYWLRLRGGDLSSELGVWLLALGGTLLAIAVQYQTFSTLYITHIWVAIGLLVGVMGAMKLGGAKAKR